ncbi:MAG TPA: transketolase, partial [Anaerolineales bacterium]|nr:transketolase [Anaerolineales bacterium]
DDVLAFFRKAVDQGREREFDWKMKLEAYSRLNPALGAELSRRMAGKLPDGWDAELPTFPADPKGLATRASSGKIINALAPILPELIGGSADLAPSNNTKIDGSPDFQKDSREGRNFHFGVREHAMGAALNGMNLFGGVIAYGGTFLIFSDYMKPAIRIAAISHIPSIFIFTHDSVGLGEDGPTHQPIEQLAALRAIPNLVVIRPADANEVTEAWKVAIQRRDGPTALALTRQAVPTLAIGPFVKLSQGAYVMKDFGDNPQLILMASGSEVGLIYSAAQRLFAEDIETRVVSFPSWELFEMQDEAYKESVLPKRIQARLAVEAGASLGWERYAKSVIGIDHYGASAPYMVIFEKFGFTVENVVAKAKELMK